MNTQKQIKLSSNWTNIRLCTVTILLILITPLILITINEQKSHLGIILSSIIFLALIALILYLFIYNCSAVITENEITLKKQFRPSNTYYFDKIGYTTSFTFKRTKYITLEMKNEDNTREKYLIVNHKSLFSFNKIDVEQTLINARNLARNK